MTEIYNKIFNSDNHEYTIKTIDVGDEHKLTWNKELGIGHIPSLKSDDEVYSQEYWDYYRTLIDTDIGKNLTQARIDIANKFNVKPRDLLDIGIGNGQFVDTFGCYGTDTNKIAIEYLKKGMKYINLGSENYKWKWFSFWDVIEHIEDITPILAKVDNIMLSTPIYKNMEDCLASKHLKINEHIYYFSVSGMITYMNHFGFDCKYYSTIESKLGRQDIGSFVFMRV